MTTMTEPQRLSQPSYADVTPERPPYLWAGLVVLGALVLYVLTLAPTTQFWDTSEYIAAAGALVAATAFTVWNQSVVNEKVYTLSLLSIALVLWLIVRWDDQPAGEAHDHHLLMIVFLLALTSTNHMMGVLVGPAVVVLLFPLLKDQ